MADNPNNPVAAKTNTFTRGMVKDMVETFNAEGVWTHARNAVNNTDLGQLGEIGNEPANYRMVRLPYQLVGAVYKADDQWIFFLSDDVDSEIGEFDESDRSYKTIVNDRCLKFSTKHLITGVARSNFDCTTSVYFDDGVNPSRYLNIDKVPYKRKNKKTTRGASCDVPEYTNELDCEAMRLATLVTPPCVAVSRAVSGGSLPNGSYQFAVAYTMNDQRVTDYLGLSNVQSLFSNNNNSGGVEVTLSGFDSDFDQVELVMISTIAENVTCRRIGFYSTRTKSVLVDKFDETLAVVDITTIVQRSPAFERSDAMFEVNGYLLRTGIYSKPELNYQPQAAKIEARWVAAEVPADYYVKGGNLTSYMRDEVYAFFIRWVYNTGERSSSFHIPGRVALAKDIRNAAGKDAIENKDSDESVKEWEVKDTSARTSRNRYELSNGATVVSEGTMGYWESSEIYPDNRPDIWGNLCGKPIRHHKFPDNSTSHIHSGDDKIVLLGVKFENITHPLDSQGKPDLSTIGYEILRGSRQGNKTVIAKGLLNNMGEYDIDSDVSTRKGLYANYPFNDLRTDPFLSKKPVKGGCKAKDYEAMGTFRDDIFSFHSPETQFRDPYLNAYELKVHGELSGTSDNQFSPVFRHPKHKMLTDLSLIVSSLAGIASGMVLIKGKTTKSRVPTKSTGVNLTIAGVAAGQITSINSQTAAAKAAIATYERLDARYRRNFVPILNAILKRARDNAYTAAMRLTDGLPGNGEKSTYTYTEEPGTIDNMPLALAIANEAFLFTYYFSQGTEAALKIMRSVVPYFQHAYQLNAHGFYSSFTPSTTGNIRRKIERANYVNPYLQEFGPEYRINNLFRSRFVAVQTSDSLPAPRVKDQSRKTIGDMSLWSNPTQKFSTPISAHYASIKIKMRNQYGQLDGISQVPVSNCVSFTEAVEKVKFTSPVYFGGDVYINRYTEKNSFFFFNDWLFAEQDGADFNYMRYTNIPYPRYWMDTNDYDITQLPQAVTGGKALPNDLASFDRSPASCRSKVAFRIKDAYFYLFANGVRDFFVESEVNLAQRDYGEQIQERHYDPYDYTDLNTLFRSDIIKSGNYFKYDYSLSAGKLFGNAINWGNMFPRDYDPKIASSCYSYYSSRVIYSLPQVDEQKKDNWKVFLANNYTDFVGDVTSINGVNQSGAMILFKQDSPAFFSGVDQLQTGNGIKITVGDGGLFASPLQQISNAESVYQYGSCQSRYSVINTPAGLFWVSQNQGRVFMYQQGLKEISRSGMKWWFSKYLPSYLLKDFPTFSLYDNPVAGVGCMLTYDSTNDILYLTKKDYRLKDSYKGIIVYSHDNVFLRNGLRVYLGDPLYFEDASFTVSFDPKGGDGNGVWVSHHDWHPDFVLPSRVHFMSIKENGVWKHNDRCDLYCNFYGEDYPFEIEFAAATGQEVSILKSIEYQLECYKYQNDCRDLHHVLDFNFDRAVVHNTEQVSGQLNMINKPKEDPLSLIDYPIVRQSSIDILYSKEENKYRFNQFYDITRNRGEFQENDRAIWETAANGYHRELNSLYMNYQKNDLQHKKMRHYLHRVLLQRMISNDTKMLLRISNAKFNMSHR